MKRALFWFLLLAALPPAYAVPSLAEPTCSTNCVSIEQKGHFAVVTGYNPEGVEVYMESVLIDEGATHELGYEGNAKKKPKPVTSSSHTTLPLRGGGSLHTTVTTFTQSSSTLINIINAVYDPKSNLYAVDVIKKRAQI